MPIFCHAHGGIAVTKYVPPTLKLRCPNPNCRQLGSFGPPAGTDIPDLGLRTEGSDPRGVILGHRICPNPRCLTHVFVLHDGNSVIASYPPERIDFDARGIPATVTATLEEALECHANRCFMATAILIRKTLEQLCEEKGSQGANLRERIGNLKTRIIIPEDLFGALDDLRLLGNDAAHIESRTYNDIGREEVEAALELTKEILKAVYQYADLLNRLRLLKKQ
jgi:hypothetical protein